MQHLESFITAKLAAGLSTKTVDWYAWLLRRYDGYCHEHRLCTRNSGNVEQFLVNLRGRGNSPATVQAYYRALRVYFGWLEKRGLENDNPLAVVERPRLPRQHRNHVTLAQFHRLYDGIDGSGWVEHRDRAILTVMFYSGLRVGETIELHRHDVDLAKRLIQVRHGKGGAGRMVPCAPLLAAPLQAYLSLRPTWSKPPLWVSCDGYNGIRGPLTAEGVRSMLRRRCAATGMAYINPHQFRHGFAMTLLNAGMEMSAVSAAMGHTSQAVTEQVYAAWLTDGLSREYAEALRRLGTT